VKDAGFHEWGQNSKAIIELNHNIIESDSIKELINNAAAKLLTEDRQSIEDCKSPLNHSVTVNWEPDAIEKFRNEDLPVTEENCLLYVLDAMNRATEQMAGHQSSFDSLVITSMENRTIRKDIRAINPSEPLIVMHIGNDRALNIIPKKFNKDMMDVLNVTLGNFSTLIVPKQTHQLMNLTIPYESIRTDSLDLHLLISPHKTEFEVFDGTNKKTHENQGSMESADPTNKKETAEVKVGEENMKENNLNEYEHMNQIDRDPSNKENQNTEVLEFLHQPTLIILQWLCQK
jgi:hypothetical protein